MAAVIETRGLIKRFGQVTALDGLDLTVEQGEVHGFLGPNGAGKSTTIRVLLGLLRSDGGTATVLGRDAWTDATEVHRHLAYVPGDVTLWPNLTGGEVIDLLGRLRGGLDPARRARLIERFELDPTKKGRSYSKGNRQKVALVAALSSDVPLLILDEPTAGLDPLMERVFQDELRALPQRGRARRRAGLHRPRGPDRRLGQPRRPAPPHADPRRGHARAPHRRRPARHAPGTPRPHPRRRASDLLGRDRGHRRGDPAPRRAGPDDPDEHPAESRGSVPRAL